MSDGLGRFWHACPASRVPTPPHGSIRPSDPAAQKQFLEAVERARDVPEDRGYLIFGDLPVWRMLGRTYWTQIRTGPRSTRLHADELRYSFEPSSNDPKHPAEPLVCVTSVRARRFTVKAPTRPWGRGRGRQALEVTVEPGSVAISVDGKRASFPVKQARDADGFASFLFNGPGYATLSSPSIVVK